MKIYFAGANMAKSSIQDWDNILLSYNNEFDKKIEKYNQMKKDISYKHLFIDSGAYTAFTQGVEIDIKEYVKFLKMVDPEDIYANLDVIGDDEKSFENWLYMKSQGLNPIAVIHHKAERKYFDLYLKEYKADFLAFGGLVPLARKKIAMRDWLDYSFSILKEYFPVKTHLFGITSDWALQRYPIYSCDSTGWLAGTKFNRVVKCKGFKISEDTEKVRYNSSLIKAEGRIKNVQNVKEYLKLEKNLTQLWAKRGVVWKD